MKKLILVVIMFLILVCTSCATIKHIPETAPNIYDNNQNIVFFDSYNVDGFILELQNWINQNPSKHIISVSTDSTQGYGTQAGWLIVYEKR